MELPSTREIDLEILVRERDKQLVVLTVRVYPISVSLCRPTSHIEHRMKFAVYALTYRP